MLPMTPPPAPDADPMPQPPLQPDLEACCGNGCDPCIFDLHDLAMDEYRRALREWRQRQPAIASGADQASLNTATD
ncbi:oxidoreductase-like domain-containing protein [Roseateles sp.]|uniref:oxidoreductase-like domain-containing protein n=1 Tax=Roseateles sp. TaxID=1971397 RepID=UPI0039E8AF7F